MTEPTTEAGRTLYRKPEVFGSFLSDILAIEAEAREQERQRLRNEGHECRECGYSECPFDQLHGDGSLVE